MRKKLFLLIPVIFGLCIPAFNHKVNDNQGGVFIMEDNGEKGPMFYAASYDSDISDEPYYSTQNEMTFEPMNYEAASNYYRGDSVKVAVIDSGLNYTHEDFINNGNQIIKGQSRTIDNTSGSWLYYQFNSGYQSKINDTLGHGTNVASVIASQINSVGCAGIAPNVELYVYKVTNTSNGYEWTAINSALSYCITEGIDVINMSFQAYEHAVSYNGSSMGASTGCSSVLTTYLNNCYNAGITLVAAAGNFNTSEPSYPASNNHVISVGSLAKSSKTTKAGYSNTYGIDLVAPGSVYVADKGNSNAYKETQGTSFSAPIVTAAIALYIQQHPFATPAQIEQALYDSCDAISGNPSWAGNGRLNIDNFLGVSTGAPTDINWTNVENDSLELEVGDTYQLQCEVLPADAINKTVHYRVDEMSDEGVVTVTDSGLVTATGVGTAFVEVYSDEITSVNNYVEITVTAPVVTLDSITIKTPPTKTTYVEGQHFDPTGLVITAHYSNGSSDDISYASHSSDFSFSPTTSASLITSNTSVTITYGDKTVSQTITVNAKTLTSITISGYKTTFALNEAFSFGGTVTAHYDNGTTSNVTASATFSGYNMSTTGNQTVTVSYGGKTATYQITINSYRTVIEEQTSETVIGTVTYPSNTKTISVNTLSTSESGYTNVESNSIRLGSGSNTGSITITSTTSNIYKAVVSAKSYGSDTSVHLTVGGDDKTITSSYQNYTKNYANPVNSVTIATTASKKRAYVSSITLYTKTTTNVNIGQSDDCVGLETFITTYMHMDYTDNLGYCKDDTHHYYSSAKEAFNALNNHQRSLFVSNSAYSLEFDRLSQWASVNGDTLNTTTNKFGSNNISVVNLNNSNLLVYVLIVSAVLSISFGCYFLINKKKKIYNGNT